MYKKAIIKFFKTKHRKIQEEKTEKNNSNQDYFCVCDTHTQLSLIENRLPLGRPHTNTRQQQKQQDDDNQEKKWTLKGYHTHTQTKGIKSSYITHMKKMEKKI